MNQREKTLVVVVAGIALLFGGNWFARNKVFGPIAEREGKVTELQDQVDMKLKAQRQLKEAKVDLARWRKSALLTSQERDSQRFYHAFLTSLFDKAGMKPPTIATTRSQTRGSGAASFATFGFNVTASGDLRSIAQVLHDFHRTDAIHRIQDINVQPNWKSDKLVDFTLICTVDVVAMKDAPKPKAIPVGTKQVPKEVEEASQAALKYFVAKNVFQPTVLENIPRDRAVVPIAAAPPADDRRDVRISGVRGRVESQALVLSYKSKTKEIVVPLGQKFEIPGMAATFIGESEEGIVLQVGAKLGTLRLGQTLADWKEVPVRTTALSRPK